MVSSGWYVHMNIITTPQWFEILSEEKFLFLCICLSSSFEKISGGNANKGAPAEII